MTLIWWVVDVLGAMVGIWACLTISAQRRFKCSLASPLPDQPTRQPASAEQALKRVLCLAALISRGRIEQFLSTNRVCGKDDITKLQEHLDRSANDAEVIGSWLREQRLWNCLSTKERTLMGAPIGTWSRQDIANSMWRQEAAGVIGWAIGLVPAIPTWDVTFDEESLLKTLGLGQPLSESLQRLCLHGVDEVQKVHDKAELWLWRARTTSLIKQRANTCLPGELTFDKILALSTQAARESGLLKPVDNDFPAMGKAYRDLTDEEWCTMRSIAHERLYALNWLRGYSADWDNVCCDT